MQDDPVPDIIYLFVYLVLAQGLKEEVDQPQSVFSKKSSLRAAQEHWGGCSGAGREGVTEPMVLYLCPC